jgi:molybdopterin converting factor small subunit
MITMRVKLFGFLSRWSEGEELAVSIEAGATVADLLYIVAAQLGPEFQRALLDHNGNLHGGLEIMLNQRQIPARRISEVPVWEDGKLAIMPLVGGGHT